MLDRLNGVANLTRSGNRLAAAVAMTVSTQDVGAVARVD
jgi:hypothetical protein